MANKKAFNTKAIQKQIDFLNKNPELKINTEGLTFEQLVKLYKKHLKS